MLPDKDLSRGNGLLEMSTFMAIILGTSAGGAIFAVWKHDLALIGVLMIAIAALGYFTSLGIPRVPASGAAKLLRLNPFGEIVAVCAVCGENGRFGWTVLGISYFWFLGALVQINILFFGKELFNLRFHIGCSALFSRSVYRPRQSRRGRLSGDHIELAWVTLGSAAMGLPRLVALAAPPPLTAIALVLLVLRGPVRRAG